MKKVVIIPVNGDPYIKDLSTEFVDYDTLSTTVEGMIECVRLTQGLNMWVNEEGKLIPLPINPIATLLWEKFYGKTDLISGPAILTAGADDEGETLGFDQDDADSLTAVLGLITQENGMN